MSASAFAICGYCGVNSSVLCRRGACVNCHSSNMCHGEDKD